LLYRHRPEINNYIMNNIVRCVLLVFVFAGILSCKTAAIQSDRDDQYKALQGKWQWIKSTGGFAGKTITPQSAGYRSSIEFKKDNSVLVYRNDSLTNQAKFTLVKTKTIFSADSAYVLKYEPEMMEEAIIKATKDTLILADNVYDGFAKTYIRK
jgi:hypothetical protein